MSLLRDQGSQALRDHRAHAHKINEQLGQIATAVSGLLCADAVGSRLGVIRAELNHLEGCAAELEAAADRAHGLGIVEDVE